MKTTLGVFVVALLLNCAHAAIVEVGAATAAVQSVTVTLSSAPPSGDIVVFCANQSGVPTGTFIWPSGFSAISGLSNIDNINSNDAIGCNYKVAGASEPTSYSVSGGSGAYTSGVIYVLSGRNTTSPFGAISSTGPIAHANFPITLAVTGVTAASGDDVIEYIGFGGSYQTSDTFTFTAPSGFTNAGATYGTTSYTPLAAYCAKANASGATGTLGGTMTDTANTGAAYAAYVIAVAPASSGGQKGGMFFADNFRPKIPAVAAAMFMPLSWSINRRNKRAAERRAEARMAGNWKRDSRSGIIVPSTSRENGDE